MNVLVVDDEQIVLDSARKHLKHDNYKVYKALSAMEALEEMEKSSIDIVLTDLMMPEMDGLELLNVIKRDYSHVPVIIITGYATINTALQAMQLGAFDYVAKPFTKAELRGAVQRAANLVGRKQSRESEVGNFRNPDEEGVRTHPHAFKGIGGHTWMMLEEDGNVLIGVERSFLDTLGTIQRVDMPKKGDELRQGSVCLQIFTTDLSSHVVWSPLSGTVAELNVMVLTDPGVALQDPYGEGWLMRIEPSKFEEEVKLLGL